LGVIFTPKNMKRDFLLGGTKLQTGGAVRGAGGAMSPPVFMLKEALVYIDIFKNAISNELTFYILKNQ
jgi:hypothetical protein